jgi:hypothetical protein
MKKYLALPLVLITLIMFTVHATYAQYADCEGTDTDPCNICYVTDAKITLKAPNGMTQGPTPMTMVSESGECLESNPPIKDWETYVGYTFCPVEGDYNGTLEIRQQDGTSIDEVLQGVIYGYTVSFDGEQEWCECGGYFWIGGQCCGDDGIADDYCIDSYESCYNGDYYTDGDSNQYTCDCGAPNLWNIGGEEPFGECCGDDTGEFNQNCQDGGLGVCAQSSDNYACCDTEDDCVFEDTCYPDGQTLSGVGKCLSGAWTDSNGPTVYDNYGYDNTWVSGEHDIEITAIDEESGIEWVRYCWGASCNPVQGTGYTSPIHISGTKEDTLRYQAQDTVGNPSGVNFTLVKLDNTPPVTSCNDCPGPSDIKGRPFTVHLSATDGHSGYAPNGETYYCSYKEPVTTCSNFQAYTSQGVTIGGDCPQGEECTYGIKYYSTDNLGNQESSKEISGMVLNTNYPSCEFTAGPSEYSNTQDIYLEWYAYDPVTSDFVRYDISAEKSTDGGNTWSTAGSVTIEVEGQTSHTFNLGEDGYFWFKCIVTYDRESGIISSSTGSTLTTVDTAPPMVQLNVPDIDYSTTLTFTIPWTGSDTGSDIDHYELSVNGSMVDDSIPSIESSRDYTGENGKSYEMEIVAYDLAGNPSQPDTATVTVDTQPPGCSIIPLNEFTNTTAFDLAWSSPDQDVESYAVCIRNDDSECTQPTPGWSDSELSSDTYKEFTGTQGNTHYFRCRATDRAGNVGDWSSPESTTIDAEPPELDEDYSSEVVAGDVMSVMLVNATVTDEFGIKGVELMVGSTKVTPKHKTGATGAIEWNLVWEIPYSTYGGHDSFTITLTDMNNNLETQAFNYSILDCLPGQVKPCHPVDKSKDEVYNLGVCAGSGNMTCGLDGKWGNCTGGTFPTDEDCNDLDDDCDGSVDENLERQECGFSDIGICRLGFRDCVSGEWTDCTGAKLPADEEVCGNQQDDNCDGSIDEGCVCTEGETQPCGSSNVGVCQMGTQLCSGGMWGECQGAVLPITEICGDSLDNDCDGSTDEGCAVTDGVEEGEPFPWWILSVAGVIIVVVMLLLWLYFKRQGKELTWETLRKKYTPA